MNKDITTALSHDAPDQLRKQLNRSNRPEYRRNQIAREALRKGAADCLQACFEDWPDQAKGLHDGDESALDEAIQSGHTDAVSHVLANIEDDSELRDGLYKKRWALQAVRNGRPEMARVIANFTAVHDRRIPEVRFEDQLREIQFEAVSRKFAALDDWIKERLVGDRPSAMIEHLKGAFDFGSRPDDMKHPLRYLDPERLRDVLDTDQLGEDFATDSFHEYFDDITTNAPKHRDTTLRPEVLDVLIENGAQPNWTTERLERLLADSNVREVVDLLITRDAMEETKQADLMHVLCDQATDEHVEKYNTILTELLDNDVRPEAGCNEYRLVDHLIENCRGEPVQEYVRTFCRYRCFPSEGVAAEVLDDSFIGDILRDELPERKLKNLRARDAVTE